MARKTGPFVGGVFLPEDAIVAQPIKADITEAELVAQIEAEMQETCDNCGDVIVNCECGEQWLGEHEH